MDINDIIRIADKAYPDGVLKHQWDFSRKEPVPHGKAEFGLDDHLARFICAEINETYDPEKPDHDQLEEAHRVVLRASEQAFAVAHALNEEVGKALKRAVGVEA